MSDAPTNEDRQAQALEDIAASLKELAEHLGQIRGMMQSGGRNPFG